MIDADADRNDLKRSIELFDKGAHKLALAGLERLAKDGCGEAFSYLGILYEAGGPEISVDYGKALHYYEQSIKKSSSLAAYMGLIRMYFEGLGVDRDHQKSLKLCNVVAKEEENPYIYFYMGKIFKEGLDGEPDLEKAEYYFKKSWELGYVFGLGCWGVVEQRSGRMFSGSVKRTKAFIKALNIAKKNINDPRVRKI